MNVEDVEIANLSADPSNVRRHSEAQIEKLVASLRRFGQTLPLLADRSNVVRVGNARLEAMKRLGWARCKIVRLDLAPTEWVALSVADNRLGDPDVGSTFDQQALADVLNALRAEDADLANATGFTLDEIAALLEPPPTPEQQTPPADFQEFNEQIETQHQCPKCGYRWSGSSAPHQEAA